jgi:hypothetical protein
MPKNSIIVSGNIKSAPIDTLNKYVYTTILIGYKALSAEATKRTAVCVVTPCSSERDRCFGGIYRLRVQGQLVKRFPANF